MLDHQGAVIKSGIIINQKLKKALKVARLPLEAATDKDWHPGSDEKVLDLVHPSLFPLIYGMSRALAVEWVGLKRCADTIGTGELVQELRIGENASADPYIYDSSSDRGQGHFWSTNFQWLPCDVRFQNENNVEIASYINNLQPSTHEHLYSVIERIIGKSIPLWDEALSATNGLRSRIEMRNTVYAWPHGKEVPKDWKVPEDQQEDYWGEDEGEDEYE